MRHSTAGLPTLRQCENLLGERAVEWHGRCYQIALALIDGNDIIGSPIEGRLDGARAVYGRWTGPVDPASLFLPQWATGHVQHGWIALPDGRVLDPTRWSFEAAKPYLYIGAADHYEEVPATVELHQ